MPLGELLFVAVAFLAAAAFLFAIATAMRNWVFELSPREWGYSMLLAFAGGSLLVAWWDGDGTVELLSGLVIFLAIVWWAYRLSQRHQARKAAAAGGG